MRNDWLAAALVCLSAAGSAFADRPPVFDIPRLDGVAIDGTGEDWKDNGFRVEMLASRDGKVLPQEDLDARCRIGWNESGLLVLVEARDDAALEVPDEANIWQGDWVELFLADKVGGAELIQCMATPGRDPKHRKQRTYVYDHRKSEELKKREITFETAATSAGDRCVVEVMVPWENLGVKPEAGREVGFTIYVDDADNHAKPGEQFNAIWFPETGTYQNTKLLHRVRLADKPSPPASAAVSGAYRHLSRVDFGVTARSEHAGKAVTITADGVELAHAMLQRDGERAAATVRAPMPLRGKPYREFAAVIDGESPQPLTIRLPDADAARAKAFAELSPRLGDYIISPGEFPAVEFDSPIWAEALIGPYEIAVDWYDAGFNRVSKAEKGGRYGAVMRIETESGETHARYATAYCTPRRVRWWREPMRGKVVLPSGTGIDPKVAAAQSDELLGEMTASFIWQTNDDRAAMTLAGLAETDIADRPVTVYESPYTRDAQWWVTLKRKLNGNEQRFTKALTGPTQIEGEGGEVLRDGDEAAAGFKPGTAEKIDAILKEWSAADPEHGFTALVARRGVIVLHRAYGDDGGAPVTTDTRYGIASLTKLLHGTLVAMFVDQGLIELEAPVERYLPELAGKTNKPMTIRHLMQLTAGMSGHWGDDDADFEHRAADLAPHLKVGERYEYNGASLALASKVMEQVSGVALPTLYQRHLLEPLRCRDTSVTNSSSNGEATAMDLARVGQMLANGGSYGQWRLLSDKGVEAMMPAPLTLTLGPGTTQKRGLGTMFLPEYGGALAKLPISGKIVTHGAASGTRLLVHPEHDLVIVVARNGYGGVAEKFETRLLAALAENLGP